ncbi:MAG: hypothetical protein AMXMBFR53_29150 [Gemmatimonadota bacterium]
MTTPPKWFRPVAVVALLWNLLGCAAYLADVSISPERVAAMSEAQQALYASRTWWGVSATAIAVWGGALGSLLLVLRRRWATGVLVASLAGVVVQDVGIFVVAGDAAPANALALGLQGFVLLVAVALVVLGRRASAAGWMS